jgi:hypothetical protein
LIPRLGPQQHMLDTHINWPANSSTWGVDHSPFAPRPPLRKLRVMIDAQHYRLATSDGPVGLTEILSGLLLHEYIDRFKYADEGPPPDAKAQELFGGWGEAYEGWVVVEPPDEPFDSRGIIYIDSAGVTHGVAYVDPQKHARQDMVAYADLPAAVAADKREADALALQVARGVEVDVYITERPYLYEARHGWLPVRLLRPQEAIAVLGLYLRSQSEYSVFRNPDVHFRMGRSVYFRVAALELLPSAWRWMAGCGDERQASGDDTLLDLAWSLIRRVQRALEARDDVHRALNRAQNNETSASILASLDVVLLLLMAALDITARVAHHVLELSGSHFEAGWQRRERWLKKVAKANHHLAAVVGKGTEGFYVLDMLTALRNSIHGEVLESLSSHESAKPPTTLLELPKKNQAELTEAIDQLGGHAAWGTREVRPGELHADPGVLVDQMFARVLDLLNAVMARTPLERLPGVKRVLPDSPPEPTRPLDTYSPINRSSIRWQLGF